MDYKLIRSKRRTLTLQIKPEGLVVRAPLRFPLEKIEAFLISKQSWIETNLEKMKNSTAAKEIPLEVEKKLREEARSWLMPRIIAYASRMNVQYAKVRITGAKTRFGSCSSTGTLSFSFRLMLYPEPAREYVVVHELAHLKQMNHSSAFYAIVASVMPDYKERQKLLK